jgi:protein involved in polysaccharide export with SLBB domain
MKKILILTAFIFSTMLQAQESESKSTKQSDILLMQPVSVTVGGFFIVTGSFTGAKTQRLDHFITAIFNQAKDKALVGLTKPEAIKLALRGLDQYALRDITLKRANGDMLKIDLLKFHLTGDFKNNPYLMQDDVIIFPAYDYEKNVINIDGAINKPTRFQYVQGDKLSDAIQFAGGLNSAYTGINQAEISRLNNSGTKEELIKVNIKDDFLLMSGDRIKILADENQKKDYKVLVLGEVKNPGYVFVTKNGTTLREVIDKAGGFKENADLSKGEFMRAYDEPQTLKIKAIRDQYERDSSFTTLTLLQKSVAELRSEDLKLYRASNFTEEELRTAFYIDNYLRLIENKGIVDFRKIYSDSSADGKFIVKEGDLIIIPQVQNLVYVYGQVADPGFVNYESGKDWQHYVKKAGGITEFAKDEEDVRIVRGINKTWFHSKDVKSIESGDLIYIPKAVPRDFGYYLQQIGAASSIVATVISLVFIIIVSTK